MKPRIGITTGLDGCNWRDEGATYRPYAEAIERAGGEPVRLDPAVLGREREVLAELEAVLFSGGDDVDLRSYPNPPALNGEDPDEVMKRYRMRPEPQRDEYELPLLQAVLDRDMPLLGICRGCQVLNVALGGRLVLDIELDTGTHLRHKATPPPEALGARHALEIREGTLLSRILPPAQYRECNSRHHQAVLVDESFTATIAAVSPEDGIIEAIEVPGRRWAIGVQWHPEHRRDPGMREMYAPLFRAFLEAAGG